MPHQFKAKLLFVQFLALLPFILFIFYLFDVWFDVRRGQVLEQNITEAKLVAKSAEHVFDVGFRVSSILTHNPLFDTSLEKDTQHAKETFQSILRYTPELSSLTLSDRDGHILITTATDDTASTAIARRLRLIQMVQGSDIPILSPPEKESLTIASAWTKEGKMNGMLTTTLQLEYLKGYLEQTLSQEIITNKAIFLIDPSGKIVFRLLQKYSPDTSQQNVSAFSFIKDASTGKAATSENIDFPGIEGKVIAASAPVGGTGWTIVSAQPINNIYDTLFQTENRLWIILFVSIIFAFSVFSYLLRKIKVVV